MLTVSNLTYRIGGRTILDDCNMTIMNGWKAGIIGLNGAGKSTLFKLIAGDLRPDGGKILISENQTFGMVRQDIPLTQDSLLNIVLSSHEEMAALWKDGNIQEQFFLKK